MNASTTTALAAAVLAFMAFAPAATVVSLDGRLEGRSALRPEGIEVAAADGVRTIPFERLVAWCGIAAAPPRPSGPQALQLARGEVLQGEIISLRAGKLRFAGKLIGEREFNAAVLAAIDFLPGMPPGGKAGWLEREHGEAVPGLLVWIDPERLAIQGPFGPLVLKREGLVRYTFAAPQAGAASDEIVLGDGSILRGALSILPDGSGLALDHPILGALRIPAPEIRAVVRAPEGLIDLAGAPPRSARRLALIAAAPPDPAVEIVRCAPTFARALRIEARAEVRFALPAAREGARLRFLLEPAAGTRGAARLVISASGHTVLDEEVGPGEPSRPVDLALPAAEELQIEVETGEIIRLPAAVILGDPHVVFPVAEDL